MVGSGSQSVRSVLLVGMFFLLEVINFIMLWCHGQVGVGIVAQGMKRLFLLILAPSNVGSCVLPSWEEVAVNLIIEYALIGVIPYK